MRTSGADQPSAAISKIREADERGAPAWWVMRKFHLTAGEYRDITGNEPEPESEANHTSGY